MTKAPRGEDPSAEVPRRSGEGWEKGDETEVGWNMGKGLAIVRHLCRKEAGNTTLECCFSLNMDFVNVDFVRDLVVTRGKTHSQVSLLLQEAYPGKRGLSSRSVRRFCLKNGIHAQNRLSNEELKHYTKEVVARVGVFA